MEYPNLISIKTTDWETSIKFYYLSNPLFPETFILKKENEPKGALWWKTPG